MYLWLFLRYVFESVYIFYEFIWLNSRFLTRSRLAFFTDLLVDSRGFTEIHNIGTLKKHF